MPLNVSEPPHPPSCSRMQCSDRVEPGSGSSPLVAPEDALPVDQMSVGNAWTWNAL